MRLFQHREIFYVEFTGGKRRSLKTKDKRVAQRLFAELKKEILLGNIVTLENQNQITIDDLKDIYLKDPNRADLSKKTHSADSLALRKLSDAIGNKNLNLLKMKHITEFKASCKAQNVKPVSVNTYLRHIKAALNYAKEQGYIKDVPKIKYNKLPDALPRVISADNVQKLLTYAKENNFEMWRIISFALYTGCRRMEILNLRYENIIDGVATIYGKGKKERIVPLIEQALEAISPLQDIGRVFMYKHQDTITHNFKKLVRDCGIQARFHDLRHTSATQMLKHKIPLNVVQKILGHADLSTTQIYAKVLSETLESEMQKLKY